ncbi:MAG: hypothetical protein JNJ54_17195 [Myxococcaceae bacterium]|nr:hypothetical protein [Myxococcaceae bacterium]
MRTLSLMTVLVAQVALARGAVEITLTPADDAALRQHIAAAKKSAPQAFTAVQAVRAQMAAIDAKKRGRFAPVTPRLNAIPDATWALAEALAVEGALDDALPRSAQVAWQTGLLEALGARRDGKTEAVLVAALDGATATEVLRSAADGLGRLGTDGAAAALVRSASQRSGAARDAVLAGMGSCRRLVVADYLARQLAVSTAEKEQLALIKALSVIGNEWALETPAGAPVKAEVPQLRAIAAGALVKRFSESSGNVRQQAQDAILIVNAPETKLLLAQARAKDPAAVDALLAKTR